MNGNNSDFLEGNGILIILFFLLAFGGNFGAFGNNGSSLENQNVINKLDTMSTGLGNATWNINDAIKNAEASLQKCCCETNRNIDSVRYENAKNTCDIINANHNETQRILDAMNHYAMEQKDVKIAEQGQLLSEQRIISAMKPVAPVPSYPVANPYTGNYGCNGVCGNLY